MFYLNKKNDNRMMSQGECNDNDSNDVLTALNSGVGLHTTGDDSGNELYMTANLVHHHHDASGSLMGNANGMMQINGTTGGSMSDDEELPHVLREQDRFLPIANVAKLMKKAIPDRGKIAKDAKECVQECVSEFISFITSEAAERCSQEKRKTINGEDILFAMSNLGFDNYVEPLKIYLQKYRESVKCDTSRLNANEYSSNNESDSNHLL